MGHSKLSTPAIFFHAGVLDWTLVLVTPKNDFAEQFCSRDQYQRVPGQAAQRSTIAFWSRYLMK